MTIGEMHDMIKLLKNQGMGAYHSPEEIDRAINSGSSDKYNELKQEFERTQTISGFLGGFKTKAPVNLTVGVGSLPTDYDYATNASTTTNKKIDIVPEGEWIDRINDPIAVPDATNPICSIRDQIEVIPTSLTSMYLYYLRKPVTMKFIYSDSGGDITHDAGSSTNCDWPDQAHVDIVLRGLVYLGAPLSDDIAMKLKAYKKSTENV